MRFLVGAAQPDAVTEAFAESPDRFATLEALLDALEAREDGAPAGAGDDAASADVLLVHAPSYEAGVGRLVEVVRASAASTIPIVLLTAAPADETCLAVDAVVGLPTDARSLRHAVDRAISLEAYRDAVDQFYDACRDRAEAAFDEDFRQRRERVDRLFSEVAPIEADEQICTVLRDRPGQDV